MDIKCGSFGECLWSLSVSASLIVCLPCVTISVPFSPVKPHTFQPFHLLHISHLLYWFKPVISVSPYFCYNLYDRPKNVRI